MTVSSYPITYDPTNSKESNFPEALAAIIAEAANGKTLRVVATSPRSYEDPATTARNQFAAALSPHKNISVQTVREDQLPRIAPPDLTVSFSRVTRRSQEVMFRVETSDLPPTYLCVEEKVLRMWYPDLETKACELKEQANDFTLDR